MRILLCLFLIASCLMSGCASKYNGVTAAATLSADDYLQLATSAPVANKAEFQLQAAERFLQNRQAAKALSILYPLSNQQLPLAQAVQRQFLLAQALLIYAQYQRTINVLASIDPNKIGLTQLQTIQWLQLSAKANVNLGNILQSIQCREHLSNLLAKNSSEYKHNIQKTWLDLQHFNINELTALYQKNENTALAPWLSLALIIDNNNNPNQLQQELSRWRARNPNHSANLLLPQELAQTDSRYAPPHNVAVLLPLSGSMSTAATAIRNGIMTAYYYWQNKKVTHPAIKMIDTHANGVVAAYQEALANHADFIIGPLLKQNITTLVQQQRLSVPTLALNTLATLNQHVNNLYQFGLSPLDEAQQAATKDFDDQHHRVIIISADNAWGKAIASTFSNTFTQLGGTVISQYQFNNERALTAHIRHLFNIDQSEARYHTLKRLLRRKIRFIPRRRKDFDSIFLVSQANMAKQIQPLIKFFFAGNIPVYSISTIYSGTPNPQSNHDLDGILFCDIPWILAPKKLDPPYLKIMQHNAELTWPGSYKKLPKLYALGIDSFDLVNQINKMLMLPNIGTNAATGTLFIDPQNHIYRQLLWARFNQGKAQLMS